MLNDQLSSPTMLSIAHEMNCPVTAFIIKKKSGLHAYDIKYFTTTTEIPACGHATLACAKLIFEQNKSLPLLTFHTIANIIIETFIDEHSVMMNYPRHEMKKYPVKIRAYDNKVEIGGTAIIYLKGEIELPTQ